MKGLFQATLYAIKWVKFYTFGGQERNFCDLMLQTAKKFTHIKVKGKFVRIKREKFQPYQSERLFGCKENFLYFDVAFAEKIPPYQSEEVIPMQDL